MILTTTPEKDEEITTLQEAAAVADAVEEASREAQRIVTALRDSIEAIQAIQKAEEAIDQDETEQLETLEEAQRSANILAEAKAQAHLLTAQAKAAQYHTEQAVKKAEYTTKETVTFMTQRQERLQQTLEEQQARAEELSKRVQEAFSCANESITQRKMRENDGTMITVVCVTYNHEKYIAEALDSFLMQKTNFKFKVFVGEDCGSDRTAEIIREYAARYPDIVIPFIREKNLGPQRNFLDMCEKATSPYIAVCDGDDYWTDEYKLQKQFDYMESHPDYRFCFAKTEIKPTETWPHYNYYKANEQGAYIIPDCLPGYHLPKAPLTMHNFIGELMIGHTSTFFFRWNYDIQFPSWFYEGIYGDYPLRLIQLGAGKAGYIEDIVSAYRVNESGVFTTYKNKDEMFLHTRIEYIRTCWGMLDWYQTNQIRNYPKVMLQNRIIREAENLFNAALNLDSFSTVLDMILKYPDAGKLVLQYYISASRDRRLLEGAWGWPGYQAIVRNKWFRNLLRPYARLSSKILKLKASPKVKKLRGKLKNLISWLCYWLYTPIPKKKNLWIVSGFRKNTYMDNTRYFYEYVVAHHPEIEIYWLTKDKNIYNNLKRDGMPVLLMNTFKCICKASRASIAVVDHYAVADFERPSGFNDRTKVVQLWHGVGFKSAVGKDGKTTTGEPGVVPSDDILAQPGDSIFRRVIKKIKYIRHAYYREFYEKYFLFLTPGQEMINRMGHPWGIPDASYFSSGYPRTEPMFDTEYSMEKPKILYAPTYRWNPVAEARIVKDFLTACPQIQALMEEINGTFILRMHPHTWRNYRGQIYKGILQYNRIDFDSEKDVYHTLGSYAITISDYSSIAVDFSLLNRPTIYFCPDFEEFSRKDTGLVPEFREQITGPFTSTWEETFEEIRGYIKNPGKDSAWAMERSNYFYAKETTDRDNSERIICEIKKRLCLK